MPEIPTIPYSQLGEMRMAEISADGIKVIELPGEEICVRLNVQVRNHSSYRSASDCSGIHYIFADVEFEAPGSDRDAFLKRIDSAFLKSTEDSASADGAPVYRRWVHQIDEQLRVTIDANLDVSNNPSVAVREALSPLIDSLKRMTNDPPIVFICHASEDKPSARAIAQELKQMGAIVWLDEWEIKIGDSIVEKVNAGLQASSHLVIILSTHSISKPWVQRELSSTLMRQLSDREIRLLPLKLDSCIPPAIISDLKYADATVSLSDAVKQLQEAVFANTST